MGWDNGGGVILRLAYIAGPCCCECKLGGRVSNLSLFLLYGHCLVSAKLNFISFSVL